MQLRHLMRIAEGMSWMQATRALAARVGREFDHDIHALDKHQLAMMAPMALLPAGLPSTLPATTALPLLPREAVRRWWLRCEVEFCCFRAS